MISALCICMMLCAYMYAPGTTRVHTCFSSPLGLPCHASTSWRASMSQELNPCFAPYVNEFPPQTACHLNGLTPRKKIGSPSWGGSDCSAVCTCIRVLCKKAPAFFCVCLYVRAQMQGHTQQTNGSFTQWSAYKQELAGIHSEFRGQ